MGWKGLLGVILVFVAVGGGCKKERPRVTYDPDWRSLSGTELGRAAWKGDMEAVRSLLAKGADVNEKRQYGDTALHEAAANGYYEICTLLLLKGADVNAQGVWTETPLHRAASGGHKKVAELLLAHGAKINIGGGLHGTPLHAAAEAGHADLVKWLLANGAQVSARDREDDTPLHRAACRGQTDVAALLVAHGADVNAESNYDWEKGVTPLYEAAQWGHKDVVDFLLSHEARIGRPEIRGRLLCFAGKHGWTDFAQRLLGERENAGGNDREVLASALRLAISQGHADTVRLLIVKGADTGIKDERGDTALHLAASTGNSELTGLLLTRDADVEEKNVEGNTALHLAARQSNAETVRLLVAHYADVNAKNWTGLTPLHYAASQGHSNVILLLLANGASVNAQDQHGDTPLHAAAARGNKDAVQLLLTHGADLQARDNGGLTAEDRAARRWHKDIVSLLAAGVDTHARESRKVAKTSGTGREQAPITPEKGAQIPENDPNLEALRVAHAQLSEAAQARRSGKDVIRANSVFAIDLYGQLSSADGNVFFSPYSISTALAMTYAAARENTEKEMAKTLHFSLDQKDLHPAFAELQRSLDKVQKAGNVRLYVANSLWPQRGKPFLAEYLSLVEKHYGVAIAPVDYTTESARTDARRAINAWVEKQTQDKIKDLLKPEHLNELTRLVLTNAIYFKGDWEHQFRVKDTNDAPFYVTPTKSVKTPMMKQTERVWYGEMNGLQILQLMYQGGELSMLILLPRERDGLGQLEKGLAVEDIGLWRQRLAEQEVVVFLPKFRITVAAELKKTLQKMGMGDAFKWPGANFAGFDGDPNWFYIGEVVHKAYVDVNEEGTEAAAATGVVVGMGGMGPPQYPVFRADHPFLFLIQENSTGTILFMGRVVDPTQTGQ